jgi:hypothetical protein
MSVGKDHINQRVITPHGAGVLKSCVQDGLVVHLDKPVAGQSIVTIQDGEAVLEADYYVIELITQKRWPPSFLANAQSFSAWNTCEIVISLPFSQNQTRIALNTLERTFRVNRFLPISSDFQTIEVFMDMHCKASIGNFDSLGGIKKAWKQKPGRCDGTTGHILLSVALSYKTMRVLARALFTTMEVVKRDEWWE